jgi:hypothetical protein
MAQQLTPIAFHAKLCLCCCSSSRELRFHPVLLAEGLVAAPVSQLTGAVAVVHHLARTAPQERLPCDKDKNRPCFQESQEMPS